MQRGEEGRETKARPSEEQLKCNGCRSLWEFGRKPAELHLCILAEILGSDWQLGQVAAVLLWSDSAWFCGLSSTV